MNQQEVIELMSSSKNSQEWNKNCDIVKSKCGGDYPLFWYKEIVMSGLMDKTLGQGSSQIRILTGDDALRAMGINPDNNG